MKTFKNLLLCFSLIVMKNFAYSQVSNENSFKLKNHEIIVYDGLIYQFNNYYYFTLYDSQEVYKLSIDSVSTEIKNVKQLKSDKLSYYLTKFADNSQAGIGLQIASGLLTYALTFANVNPLVFIAPSVISATGFIIWVSSYNHLKKYKIIADAKEYKTFYVE
jgi:hypothetical protein